MTKFEQMFLQNWDIKISVKNVQISLQEYLKGTALAGDAPCRVVTVDFVYTELGCLAYKVG